MTSSMSSKGAGTVDLTKCPNCGQVLLWPDNVEAVCGSMDGCDAGFLLVEGKLVEN